MAYPGQCIGSIIILDMHKLCGRPPQYASTSCDLNLWLFDLESGVRVTCDADYLCVNFSLPKPLCFRLRPDVRDKQTDVRCASSLNVPYPRDRGIIRSWHSDIASAYSSLSTAAAELFSCTCPPVCPKLWQVWHPKMLYNIIFKPISPITMGLQWHSTEPTSPHGYFGYWQDT